MEPGPLCSRCLTPDRASRAARIRSGLAAPVELHRTTFTADGTVVEFAIGVHAASRFAWSYDFKVPDSARSEGDAQ